MQCIEIRKTEKYELDIKSVNHLKSVTADQEKYGNYSLCVI